MTVVVTVEVAPRFRGFLTSCMLEIAPGVYTSPRMTRGVRERVWRVMEEWYAELAGSAIVMTWPEKSATGGQGIALLGAPPKELHDAMGIYLTRRELRRTAQTMSRPRA